MEENGNADLGDYEGRLRLRILDGTQSECDQCRFLPICWGPCVAKREDMLKNHGKILCQVADPEADLTANILNIGKSVMQVVDFETAKI